MCYQFAISLTSKPLVKAIRWFEYKKAISLFIFIYSVQAFSQSYEQQQRQIFAYNILLNGCIGGIGGVINKNKTDRFWPTFGKNFLKGSLGGVIKYSAKRQLYHIPEQNSIFLSCMNRAYYYVGHSIVMNASLNKSLLDGYIIDLYGAHLDFRFKEKLKVKPRLSLLTLFTLTSFLLDGNHLLLDKSLVYGIYYFKQSDKLLYKSDGFAFYNGIAINSFSNEPKLTLTHELVHTYQFPDYFLISNFVKPWTDKLNSYEWYQSLSKFIYLDLPYNSLFEVITQPRQDAFSPHYYRNFYEFEAEHFAIRSYVDR